LTVVCKDDSAKKPADLAGYEIIFGSAECDAKHAAAIELLERVGVPKPKKLPIDEVGNSFARPESSGDFWIANFLAVRRFRLTM